MWHQVAYTVVLGSVILLSAMTLGAQTATPPVESGGMPIVVMETPPLRPTTLNFGATLTSDFDDNALNDNRHARYNSLTVIEPHIRLTSSRSDYDWKLDYRQGFSISQPFTTFNSRSYILDTSFRSRVSKRLTFRADEEFLESTNPFDGLLESTNSRDTTIVDRPAGSILTALRTRNEQAGLDLTYALSSHSTFAAVGSFFDVNQTSLGATDALGKTRSVSGHAIYSRRLSRRHSMGIDYGTQTLIAQNPQVRASVQSFSYANTVTLTPNSVLSFSGGPERSIMREQSIPIGSLERAGEGRSSWNWVGSAGYKWSDGENSAFATYSHRLTNGEGLLGIVRLSDVSTQLQRRLTRKWHADLLASYDKERTVGFTSSGLSYVSVAGGLTRKLSRPLSLQLVYWRIHELMDAAGSDILRADHNRVSVSLTYDLQEMIGK